MTFKYDKQLIFDYIAGSDILEYDVDQLENDPIFMTAVINLTGDKKMYALCSEKVKDDYDFVKNLIMKFQNDKDFIIPIVNGYNAKHQNEELNLDVIELNIIMSNLFNANDERALPYRIYSMASYANFMVEMSRRQRMVNDIAGFGKGFTFVDFCFEDKPIVLDFFASQMLNDIFYKNDNCSFEELIHMTVNDKFTIINQGVSVFLINYIKGFDINLADYVAKNIKLLDKIKEDINVVIKNWDYYIERLEQIKVEIYIHKIEAYYDANHERQPWFTPYQLIRYIVNELAKNDLFMKNYYYRDYYESCLEFNIPFDITIDSSDIVQLKYYQYAVKLFKQIFNKHLVIESELEYADENLIRKR